MDPQDRGTRGQPVISMGWGPLSWRPFLLRRVLKFVSEISSWPQEVPLEPLRYGRTAQEASKTAQDAHKTPTRRPRRPPRGDFWGFLRPKSSQVDT